MTIYDEVKKIVMNIIDSDEKDIKPESAFVEDLGADSLDVVEIIMAIEEKYNIEISDEETENIKTVEDVVKVIGIRINNKK